MFQTKNWSWKNQKNAAEVGKSLNSALIMAVSDLNWAKQWPKSIENNIHLVYIMNLKIHVSDPKLIMKDPKIGDEVGKSLNSALIKAVSDLNWKTLWPKRIENKIQSVFIKDLKIHASDPKLIIKDPKNCRWNWKISKFCSHNGNFRSELSKIMTQRDWKQYPIGMYQGSKIYMFQTHNWSWKVKIIQMK